MGANERWVSLGCPARRAARAFLEEKVGQEDGVSFFNFNSDIRAGPVLGIGLEGVVEVGE